MKLSDRENKQLILLRKTINTLKAEDKFKALPSEKAIELMASIVGIFIGGKCLNVPTDEGIIPKQYYIDNLSGDFQKQVQPFFPDEVHHASDLYLIL